MFIVVSADRFGLGFTHDAFNFSCHMSMHLSCIRSFLYTEHAFTFYSLSLSLIDSVMTPKQRKSFPARTSHGSGPSSSSIPPVPSHIWFLDEKAKSDFFENFQDHGAHLERQVILSNFADTPLSEVIRT